MAAHVFSFPTLIHFGPGVSVQARAFLTSHQKKRPLIVTDRGIAPLPMFRKFLDGFGKPEHMDRVVFSEVLGNPTESQVVAGVAAFKSHKADSIVGIGGGAALDVAKAIALMAHHPGKLFDYEDGKADARPIDGEIPFLIALPTTSGTGSEVGRSAVISDDTTHVKKIVFSPRLLAKAVFADPELTLDLPANITAATGMDALTHCIEAFLAKNYHPLCDGIALEGLRIGAANLVRCVETPGDVEARGAMMMSSMMGAIAFQKGLGLTHSCAHALSAVSNLHHGLANAVMMPHALPFNVPAVPEKFARMAVTIGLEEAEPGNFIAWITDLNRRLKLPTNLTEAGVKKEFLGELVKGATADSCHQNNPRPVTESDFQSIFQSAF